MSAPKRIQRRRAKGWTMPVGAVYVGRPSKWGSPFRLGDKNYGLVHYGPEHLERFGREWDYEGRISAPGMSHPLWLSAGDVVETHVRLATAAEAVELYWLAITRPTWGMRMANPSRGGHLVHVTLEEIIDELVGRDLACWCPLDQPCHADVLLNLANGGAA